MTVHCTAPQPVILSPENGGAFWLKTLHILSQGKHPIRQQHYSCHSPSVTSSGSVLPLVFDLPALRLAPTLASRTHHSQPWGGTGGAAWSVSPAWCMHAAWEEMLWEPRTPRCAENAGGGEPFPGGWHFKIKWDKIHILACAILLRAESPFILYTPRVNSHVCVQ